MSQSQSLLYDVVQAALTLKKGPSVTRYARLQELGASETGRTFIDALFLICTSQALLEQHWLLTRALKAEQPAFNSFLRLAMNRELAPLGFLAPLWLNLSAKELKTIADQAKILTKEIIAAMSEADISDCRTFAVEAVRAMADLSSFDNGLRVQREEAAEKLARRHRQMPASKGWLETRPLPVEGLLPSTLDRAFDPMDKIFQLQFELDLGMKKDPRIRERLYEGSGIGVQTSYATILTVLNKLSLAGPAHFMDLGSGYGRVGLIAGLLLENIHFSGYEFVGHRVDVSRAAAERVGIGERVRFYRQDLASENFLIPEADVYYMYDPFCEETYRRILKRLKDVGLSRAVTVVAKGDAGKWFSEAIAESGWSPPVKIEGGNLLLIRSRP